MELQSKIPPVTHLVGVSIPRSGHHYLSTLLKDILRQDLHYCEFYAPLDCCHTVPCSRGGAARLVFQKNHDFDLSLDANLAGVLYVVQTRSPLLEALSDRELAEAVRPELAGDPEDLVVWLGKKAAYCRHFHRKWITGGPTNCVHIPYETLLQDPAGVLRNLLQRTGMAVDPQAIESAVARRAGIYAGGSRRFKAREPQIPAAARPAFEAYAAMLAGLFGPPATSASTCPPETGVHTALHMAATAHGAAMAHDLPAATDAWREFCRQFPKNPYGHVELSRCLEELGKPRDALHSALKAARQTPPRLEAVKRARDLLAQSGRCRSARHLAAAIAQRFPGRPVALIDLAVDLYHSGMPDEAVAAARRFAEVAAAAPIESGVTKLIWNLRCTAYGFSAPSFWEAACHIFLAGNDAKRALDAASFAFAMSGGNAAYADLVTRAQQAVDLT